MTANCQDPMKMWRCMVVVLLVFLEGTTNHSSAQSVHCCDSAKQGSTSPHDLTESERAAGWKLLFDGKTSQGWRGFRRQSFPSDCWKVEKGCLHLMPDANKQKWTTCGDIVSIENFDNFEFRFEWCICPGGNSGVKYLISEDRPQSWEQAYLEYHYKDLLREAQEDGGPANLTSELFRYTPIGFEFQLIDDQANEDARSGPTRVTGALYDLLAPSPRPVRPAGEFNDGRIVVQGLHIEHWINEVKVLEFERESQQLRACIRGSKFTKMEGFGSVSRGHIDLQDHGDEIWFRNLRIRVLQAK